MEKVVPSIYNNEGNRSLFIRTSTSFVFVFYEGKDNTS